MNQVAQTFFGYVQTPTVSVTKGMTKSTHAPGVENNFFAQLQGLLHEEEASDMQMLHPSMLMSIITSLLGTEDGENVDHEQLVAKMMEALEQNLDPALRETLLQSDEMSTWMAQTMQIVNSLSSMTTEQTSLQHHMKMTLPEKGMPVLQDSTPLHDLHKTINALLEALRLNPKHEALIQQQNELKDMFRNFILTSEPAGKEMLAQLSSIVANGLAQSIIKGNESQPLWQWFSQMNKQQENVTLSSMNPIVSNGFKSEGFIPFMPQHVPVNWNSFVQTNPSIVQSSVMMETSMNQVFPDNIPLSMIDNTLQTMSAAEMVRIFGNDAAQVMKSIQTPIPSQQLLEHLEPLLMKHMKFAQHLNGVSEARISLVPEHLGQVDIRITMQNGQLVAHFMAETMMGKELLEAQLAQLRAALQSQGIQVEKLEVSQNNNAQFNMFQESKHQHSSQQFAQQNKQKSVDYERIQQQISLDYFDEEVVHSGYVNGNSFHAMA